MPSFQQRVTHVGRRVKSGVKSWSLVGGGALLVWFLTVAVDQVKAVAAAQEKITNLETQAEGHKGETSKELEKVQKEILRVETELGEEIKAAEANLRTDIRSMEKNIDTQLRDVKDLLNRLLDQHLGTPEQPGSGEKPG